MEDDEYPVDGPDFIEAQHPIDVMVTICEFAGGQPTCTVCGSKNHQVLPHPQKEVSTAVFEKPVYSTQKSLLTVGMTCINCGSVTYFRLAPIIEKLKEIRPALDEAWTTHKGREGES
ncbi:hypothetical protein [Alloalcanivorax venustensis]|jgi:hypothetical protein|uniref:hypothetical protein n=1 Tax=Alloalcanivorax venustensis TaxID=172371 RepID=UPI001ED5C8F9|nr:hypothetical protein [Alcanivorax sp.]